MRLVFKVDGAPRIEARSWGKVITYNGENAGLFDWIQSNCDLLEFRGNIKIPVARLVSFICDKLHVRKDMVEVTNTWYNFTGTHDSFLLIGEIDFEVEGRQLNGNTFDVTDEMYEVFDEVFNYNDCFYDKFGLEKGSNGDLDFYVFWNDDATQCLGAITESRGERKK